MNPALIVFFLILIVILLVSLIGRKRRAMERDYDEREQLVRGRAYARAFAAFLLFEGGHILALLFYGRPLMADGVSSLLGFFLSIAVFAVYCIRHDAFKEMRTDQKFRSYSILLVIVVAINAWSGIMAAIDGNLLHDGVLQTPVASFACAACFLSVLLAMRMQRRRNDREEEA